MDLSILENKKKMLGKLLSDIAQEQNYKDATIKIEATSSEGANYSSILYNAEISAPNKKDLKLFAKVGNLSEQIRETMPIFLFDTERFVYRDLANIFKKIEQKAGVSEEHRFVFPKFYGYNPNMYEETIVLENLAAQGYVVYDRMKSIDWPYAAKAIETLAKFHALAMAYEEENPEEYNKLLKKLEDQMNAAIEPMSEGFNLFKTKALQVTRVENKERLQNHFDNITAAHGHAFWFVKPKRKAVLIHGDYRPSNIMHKIKEDGSVDLIPLDYQTISCGCGVADFLYFIFGGSDAEFRAKYYQRLVDHYYDNLSLSLKRLKLDPKKIYPREDFDYDLQETLPFGLSVAVKLLPIVTVESQHAPDINNDAMESMSQFKTSSVYPERLNGVIDDYVRWGVL